MVQPSSVIRQPPLIAWGEGGEAVTLGRFRFLDHAWEAGLAGRGGGRPAMTAKASLDTAKGNGSSLSIHLLCSPELKDG